MQYCRRISDSLLTGLFGGRKICQQMLTGYQLFLTDIDAEFNVDTLDSAF